LYAYDHLPQPALTGYTSMAWTGPRIQGDVSIGSKGKELHFQIVHHEPGTTVFRLSATWAGTPSTLLAKPVSFTIGPDRTFQGTILIPSPPDGCIYRVVVALTAERQINPLTNGPQTWNINADVRDPSKTGRACK
jgi:hypothetical protein